MAPTSPPLRPERTLRWEGCCNIRDLGGLPLEDDGETRFGVVVRADDISLLTDAGWKAVADYKITLIVNLRHEDDGHYEARSFDVARVPLANAAAWDEIEQLLANVEDPTEWRRRNYLFCLERFAGRFGRAVSTVAQADGRVLVHCAGGVDRTGLVAALILRVAGVGIEAIASDYALSEANWAPSVHAWVEEVSDEAERRKRRLLSVMSAKAMYGTMVELEREHGGAREYLLGAGVADEDLDRLRARLRG